MTMDERPTQDKRPKAIRLELVGILLPKTKWEQDLIEGGARKIVSIAFAIPDLSDSITAELAAQSFAGSVANVTIELLGPSFYMGDIKDGQVMNAKTGEIQGTIYGVEGVAADSDC